jgi:Resolvase, N terminal domain
MSSEPNNPPSAPRCAIYTRCATDEAGAGAESIKRQEQSCRAVATQNGWIVLDNHVYTDLRSSGNTPSGRAEWDALLEAARTEPRPFDRLLVEEGSRLARNLSIVVKMVAELNSSGVQVHLASAGLASGEATDALNKCGALPSSTYENNIDGTAAGQLAAIIYGAFNQFFAYSHSEKLRERSRLP